MSPFADASSPRHVQSIFPAATHAIDHDAAKEQDTQDDFHPALDTDDEDVVGAEENEHQLREGGASLRRLVEEDVERKAA
jgi:hypothetical protein